MIVHHFTTPITTPFARKSTQIYGDLHRFWEKAKIKESAKKPEITGLYRLIKGYKIMIKILFVCHGNICRSPMALYYFRSLLKERGLSGIIQADSAATSTEEIGNPVHHGTRAKLKQAGIPCEGHRAKQMTKADYKSFDYLIGMDSWNIRNMQRIAGGDPDHKIFKLMELTGSGRDVADPWYTGDFDTTWSDVTEGCAALLDYISERL